MRPLALPVLALFALAVARPAVAAWPNDPFTGGLPVCAASGNQTNARAVPDGAGGAIVVWTDQRAFATTADDLYAQRINAAGLPLWAVNGVAVCNQAASQGQLGNFAVAPDALGGVLVVWEDARNNATNSTDIYAQRVDGTGALRWTSTGVPVCATAGSQRSPVVTGDGGGGAIIAWADTRAGNSDIYARRVTSAGVASWTANGTPIITETHAQENPQIVSDGGTGAIIGWEDFRSNTSYDIYAQRVSNAGILQWSPSTGVTLVAGTGNQAELAMAADGFGGAIAAWRDARTGVDTDIYAQRVDGTGDTKWPTGGFAVSTSLNDQSDPVVVADGVGGGIVGWFDLRNSFDGDLYAQRIAPGGGAMWTSTGVPLCTVAETQSRLVATSDGNGGAVFAWHDERAGLSTYDVFAQRVSAGGSLKWTSGGAAIVRYAEHQWLPTLAADGSGGAIVAWGDRRLAGDENIWAQRVDMWGELGNVAPAIARIRDVAGDQGGQVAVEWTASPLDGDPDRPITSYTIWRRVPTALAQQMLAQGAAWVDVDGGERVITGAEGAGVARVASLGATTAGGGMPRLLAMPGAAQTLYWAQIGTQSPRGLPGYSFVAATTTDSMAGSNPRTSFMVGCERSSGTQYWFSAADSGYSVDNLAPAQPQALTGQYAAGSSSLHWARNGEVDLAGYRLYRGSSTGFVPGPSNLLATLPDTGYVDVAGAPYVYKLSAVDVHGNESPIAVLTPQGVLAVDGSGGAALFLSAPVPNPVSDGREAVLRFGLPAAGRVTLALYDAAGRRVRMLADGVREAGEHRVSLDAGHLAPGLYLARLETPLGVRTVRVVRVD